MNSLRKHPVLLSIIIWAFLLITYQMYMVNQSPQDYNELNPYLVGVLGILSTVLGFAAKWMGRDQ